MHTDANIVWTSMTPTMRGARNGAVSRVGTQARLGYIEPGHLSRRAVIYLSDTIHIDITTQSPLDTAFDYDHEIGPFAIIGDASEVACEVVATVRKYAWHAFHEYLGIRICESDRKEYASKIVFYLARGSSINEVCDAVAGVVFGTGNPFASDTYYSDLPSDGEGEAQNAYNLLDY